MNHNQYSTEVKYALTHVAATPAYSALTGEDRFKLLSPLVVRFGKIPPNASEVNKRVLAYKKNPFTQITKQKKEEVEKIIADRLVELSKPSTSLVSNNESSSTTSPKKKFQKI